MADRTALGMIGLMLGAATMFVMMVGAFVIGNYLTDRSHLEEGLTEVALPAAER
jgi:hypothetical protein